ncbi:MAG: hypothetical protein JW759_04390 [Candidatus Coatesbacteria bacterium]|nr:hypothetical protein [Candidatus Coatesbacteria bacterium]
MLRQSSIGTLLAVLVIVGFLSAGEATAVQSQPRTASLTEAGQIVLSVRDDLSGVDPSSIRLVIDGLRVSPSLVKIAKGYRVSYTPPGSSSGEYNVELFASDMASNSMRRAYRFIGAPSVTALGDPQRSEKDPASDRPLLSRAADGELNAVWRPIDACKTRPVNMAPRLRDAAGGSAITAPGLIPPGVPQAVQFDVAITKELRVLDQKQLYEATFEVRGVRIAEAKCELFIGLIDHSGEVVFYEPEPGRRGIAIEELERVSEGRSRLKLSFAPGEFLGADYTWCAVVAQAGTPENTVSNVASAPFDVSAQECDTRALDAAASSP